MPPKRDRDSNNINHTNTSQSFGCTLTAVTTPTLSPSELCAVTISIPTSAIKTISTSTAMPNTSVPNAATSLPIKMTSKCNDTESEPELAAEQKQQIFVANSKLCRLVRKNQWLYNRKHPNYGKKQVLEKTWTKIAKDCNDSVASCKERWRNIRAAFARSVNIYKTHSGPNRVKPYYLHKELNFLLKPMTENLMRSKTYNAEYETKEEMESDNESDKNDEVDIPIDAEIDGNVNVNAAEDMQVELNSPTLNTSVEHGEIDSRGEYENIDENCKPYEASEHPAHITEEDHKPEPIKLVNSRVREPLNHTESMNSMETTTDIPTQPPNTGLIHVNTMEADRTFLEALLPDMYAMNPRQKIVFKRKIYETLEQIFENNADFPAAQQRVGQQVSMHPMSRSHLTCVHATLRPQMSLSQHSPCCRERISNIRMGNGNIGNSPVTVMIPSANNPLTSSNRTLQPLNIKEEIEDISID